MPNEASAVKPAKQQCRHIHANGKQCRSIALRGQPTCFCHRADTIGRNVALDAAGSHAFGPNAPLPLDIPLLDNQAAITLALTQTMRLISAGILTDRRSGQLLYGLNIAQRGLDCQQRHERQERQERQQNKQAEAPVPQEPEPEITRSGEGEWLGPEQRYFGPNGKAEVRWDFGKWYYVAGLKKKMIQQVTAEEVAEIDFPEEGYLTEEEMANPQLVHDLCDGKREEEVLAQLKQQGSELRAQGTEDQNQGSGINEQGVETQNTQRDAAGISIQASVELDADIGKWRRVCRVPGKGKRRRFAPSTSAAYAAGPSTTSTLRADFAQDDNLKSVLGMTTYFYRSG